MEEIKKYRMCPRRVCLCVCVCVCLCVCVGVCESKKVPYPWAQWTPSSWWSAAGQTGLWRCLPPADFFHPHPSLFVLPRCPFSISLFLSCLPALFLPLSFCLASLTLSFSLFVLPHCLSLSLSFCLASLTFSLSLFVLPRCPLSLSLFLSCLNYFLSLYFCLASDFLSLSLYLASLSLSFSLSFTFCPASHYILPLSLSLSICVLPPFFFFLQFHFRILLFYRFIKKCKTFFSLC